MQVQRHSRVYDFLGSSKRAKWDNEQTSNLKNRRPTYK
jgi:hypothetical protein